jgi:two-component system, NarL family, response regulator DevR
MPIRVVLVDDHEIVRQGLRALIETQDDLAVVGEAGTGEEGVKRVGLDEPDVVVMDVRMPDQSGIEACREIRSRFPDVKVLMLTSFADEEALVSSIMAGAAGYLLKRVKSQEILQSIRRAANGESMLDPEMVEGLFARIRHGPKSDPLLSRLTDRELEIVDLIAEGLTNREIGERLFLAEKTVKNYVSNILTKMGMTRRSEAAAYVARNQVDGMGPPEEW